MDERTVCEHQINKRYKHTWIHIELRLRDVSQHESTLSNHGRWSAHAAKAPTGPVGLLSCQWWEH